MQPVPLTQGQVFFDRHFLSPELQLALYYELKKTLAWQQDEIRVFGKQVTIPRMQAWYGDLHALYRYSGTLMTPLPWTDSLASLKEKVEQACECRFNSVLANWYRNGMDKMGFHADNEKELGDKPVIASLSLGTERKFVLKHRNGEEKVELRLPGGSLLVMAGDTQTFYKHAVPQQKRVTEGRINLTFRYTCPQK